MLQQIKDHIAYIGLCDILTRNCGFQKGTATNTQIENALDAYTPTAQLCALLSAAPCSLQSKTQVDTTITNKIDAIDFCAETADCGYLTTPGGSGTTIDFGPYLEPYLKKTDICTALTDNAQCGLEKHVDVCHDVGYCFVNGVGCPA